MFDAVSYTAVLSVAEPTVLFVSGLLAAERRRAPRSGPRGGGLSAPAHPDRGARTGPSPVDRGRLGSTHHLITDAAGTPLAVILTEANRHHVTQLLPLIEAIGPIRGRRGRPRQRPRKVYADRGYAHGKYRCLRRARGSTPVLARRGVAHGFGLGTKRWVVKRRTFAWLHAVKRLPTRYERRADLHQAMLSLACAVICRRRLLTSF